MSNERRPAALHLALPIGDGAASVGRSRTGTLPRGLRLSFSAVPSASSGVEPPSPFFDILSLPPPPTAPPAPGSPEVETFLSNHAAFKHFALPSIARAWEVVHHPGATRQRRLRRSMSLGGASEPLLTFASLVNEYIRKRNFANDTDANAKIAAGLGSQLVGDLEFLQRQNSELKQELDHVESQYKKLQRKHEAVQLDLKELQAERSYTEDERDDGVTTVSLQDFLKKELATEKYTTYSGDLTTDLQVLRKKLSRERKAASDRKEKDKEQIDGVEAELKQAQDELAKLRAIIGNTSLQEEVEALQQRIGEYEDVMQKERMNFDEALRRKTDQLRDSQTLEAKSAREVRALERELNELRERRLQEITSLEAHNKALVEEVSQLKDREVLLLQDADLARLDEARALQRRRLQELESGTGAAANVTADALPEEKRRAESELANIEEARRKRKETQDLVQARLDELKDTNDRLRSELEATQQHLAVSEQEIAELRNKLASFKQVGISLREVVDQERNKRQKLEQQIVHETQEKGRLEQRIQELEKKLEDADTSEDQALNSQELQEKAQMMELLEKEKADLEIKLMVMTRQDLAKMKELQRKEDELKELRKKVGEMEAERLRLEQRFLEVEREDQLKFAKQHETINQITRHMQELYAQYKMKEQENKQMAAQLEALRTGVDDVDGVKSAKAKYKEMGKKMLSAMKQMDTDMKDLMKKHEEAQAELKQVHKEKRKLQRKIDEMQKEMEMTEKQMNKLMRLCISGTVGDEQSSSSASS